MAGLGRAIRALLCYLRPSDRNVRERQEEEGEIRRSERIQQRNGDNH